MFICLLAVFRRRQIKKTFTHGMKNHVVSKGLANPSLLVGGSASGWQATVMTKNGPAFNRRLLLPFTWHQK
jgi:hypothetical protein